MFQLCASRMGTIGFLDNWWVRLSYYRRISFANANKKLLLFCDSQRLNVSMTRAKCVLYWTIIGNLFYVIYRAIMPLCRANNILIVLLCKMSLTKSLIALELKATKRKTAHMNQFIGCDIYIWRRRQMTKVLI